MNQKIFSRYIEVARALKPSKQSGKSFHVTCIFDKSKILSIGVNDYNKHHPRHIFGKYQATKGGNYTAGVHSEVRAIIRLGEEDCSRLSFFNIRIGNNGETAMSKPCRNCLNLLSRIGYKRLFYTSGKDAVCEL